MIFDAECTISGPAATRATQGGVRLLDRSGHDATYRVNARDADTAARLVVASVPGLDPEQVIAVTRRGFAPRPYAPVFFRIDPATGLPVRDDD